MKKIAVVGLGIIGGSICMALTRAGFLVDGFDKNEEAIHIALDVGCIQNRVVNLDEYDVVFLAVPPKTTMEYLDNASFKEGALVTDICGIKSALEKVVYKQARTYRYMGIHPMAGKEKSGIQFASADLFKNANIIITQSPQTNRSDVEEIKEYILAMGFGEIIQCTAEEHDRKIALTSQLAHIVSNAYVKSEQVYGCEGFTGGSFQDMTRIAGVDEGIWTQLYFGNREYLIEELGGIIQRLHSYCEVLEKQDVQGMEKLLKEGRLIREQIKRNNE